MQDALISRTDSDPAAWNLLARSKELLTGLPRQQAAEADLIYEALETDIGVCD